MLIGETIHTAGLSIHSFPRAREAMQGTGTQAISAVIPRGCPLY
jgi:hypothetical protein